MLIELISTFHHRTNSIFVLTVRLSISDSARSYMFVYFLVMPVLKREHCVQTENKNC